MFSDYHVFSHFIVGDSASLSRMTRRKGTGGSEDGQGNIKAFRSAAPPERVPAESLSASPTNGRYTEHAITT